MRKFSVLIAVYYKEKAKHLDEALASVYSQTVSPTEVVICEDGKLTPTLNAVIQKYKNAYPKITKIIEYPKNRGLGATLRDGVLACKNEIIFRMDSDDISMPTRFEKQLKAFTDSNADIVGCNIQEYDEKMKKKVGVREVPESHEEIYKYAKTRNPINHMTVGFKKSAILSAGNYQDMPGFEDYFLWVRMLKNGAIFYNIQECLIYARCGNSFIQRRGGKQYLKAIRSFEKAILSLGFISRFDYIKNLIVRYSVAIAPSNLRSNFYAKKLRSASI